MRFLRFLLALAGLAGIALLADRLFPSEEGEVKDRIVALERGLRRRSLEPFEAYLAEDFRFESTSRILGSGDRDAALRLARRVVEGPRWLRLRMRRIRAEVEGDAASVQGNGEAWAFGGRRSWHGFEFRCELARGADAEWLVRRARIDLASPEGGPAGIAGDLVAALLAEDLDRIGALLAPNFRFKSEDPSIPSGDRGDVLERLGAFFAANDALAFEEDEDETRDEEYPFHGWASMEGTLSGAGAEGREWSRRIRVTFRMISDGESARVTEVRIGRP